MSNKHDANVRKNTLVNFQIGLIASLLFSYVMFEVYTAVPNIDHGSVPEPIIEETYEWNTEFIEYKEPEKQLAVKSSPKKMVDFSEPKVIDNNTELKKAEEEFKNELVKTSISSEPIDSNAIIDKEEEEDIVVPFDRIESAPIFPGCERLKTNKEKATCFSEKIAKIVSRKFNTSLGQEYGLTGIQRIYTQFDVDSDGMITNIQVRAPHPRLKKEAERVINMFPEMTPGKQRGKPVTVKYQLPIVFQIQN